jgi:hypothetical protein
MNGDNLMMMMMMMIYYQKTEINIQHKKDEAPLCMDDKNDTIAIKFKGLTPSEFLDKMEMRALRVLN